MGKRSSLYPNQATGYLEDDKEVIASVSIGLAQYRKKEEMKAFVHRVDQLMYQGKKNGKGRICSD